MAFSLAARSALRHRTKLSFPSGDGHSFPPSPVLGLDLLHNVFHRGHIRPIAGEDLVSQRKTFPAHHQGNAYLFAVRTMVPGIATLRLPVEITRSFEVGRV